MQTRSMDLSNGLLQFSLLLVSLLIVLSVSVSKVQGRNLESRSSDLVHVERRPNIGSVLGRSTLSMAEWTAGQEGWSVCGSTHLTPCQEVSVLMHGLLVKCL